METFELIIGQAMNYSRGVACKILRSHRDDVDDVLQNAAIQAWRFRDTFRGESRFQTYFHSIVIREALMHLRRRRRQIAESLDELTDLGENEIGAQFAHEGPSPEQMAYAAEIQETINSAIQSMSPILSDEAMRFVAGDRGTAEFGRKARRFRARKILQKALKERGIYAA